MSTTTTRTGPEIRAELDTLVDWRDSYARVTAQAVADGDPAAAMYAASYARTVARIAEVREERITRAEEMGIPAMAITSLINLRRDDDTDERARVEMGESL